MAKVRVVTPLCEVSDDMAASTMKEVEHLNKFGLEIDFRNIEAGPDSIEGHLDEALAAPYVVVEAIKAQNEGVDAVVIDCMGDPGMAAAREVVSIPVVGPGEACMHVAAMMGNRFSCVSILDSVKPIFFAHARAYGIADKLVSVRTIDLLVLELDRFGHDSIVDRLFEQSMAAVEREHADTIILGCTGFAGVADDVHRRLVDSGYVVPVINPLPTAVLLAAMMVNGGLSHSPHAYPAVDRDISVKGFKIPALKR